MAALGEVFYKLRSNEAGASDDDDLHGISPLTDGTDCRRGSFRVPLRGRQVLVAVVGLPWRQPAFSSKAAGWTVRRAMGCRIINCSH
ncbi:hypothetical protein D3C76_1064070 [compost metagenome]